MIGLMERLEDILARIQEHVIEAPVPSMPPPPTLARNGQQTQRAGHPRHPARSLTAVQPPSAVLSAAAYIPAEVFLEHLGFFTPSSKRIRGISTKEKVVGEKRAVDGTTQPITVCIRASAGLGLPITADLDYYRGFLHLLDDAIRRDGKLRLPLSAPTNTLLRAAGKPCNTRTWHEVRTWLTRMTLTGIEGGVFNAKTGTFREGFVGTVFHQVATTGDVLKNGQRAETNYIWPAAWFLSNYLRGYVRRIDLALHRRLRKPIAKALYPLLSTGWYAATGQAYRKRYRGLCHEFLLTAYRQLSRIRQQLDPAHHELQHEGLLKKWTYHKAAANDDWVITYWPGSKFFQEHDVKAHPVQLPDRVDERCTLSRAHTTASSQLLQEILEICGDHHNAAAYRQAVRTYTAHLLRMGLAETRDAVRARRISATRGAFFFDTLHRLSARWPQALSPSPHPSSPANDTDPDHTAQSDQ